MVVILISWSIKYAAIYYLPFLDLINLSSIMYVTEIYTQIVKQIETYLCISHFILDINTCDFWTFASWCFN